nr:mannan-binding lectin serine protease 2-like [Salvelinus alpinus]
MMTFLVVVVALPHVTIRWYLSQTSVVFLTECEEDPDNGCTQFCHNYIGGYLCSCHLGYYLDTDGHTCTVSCTEDLSGSLRGVISSPSRPGPYAEHAHCSYILSVEDNLELLLHFTGEFDVEQGPDGQCVDTLMVETSAGTQGHSVAVCPPPPPRLGHTNAPHYLQL